jgi:hypothetical protein
MGLLSMQSSGLVWTASRPKRYSDRPAAFRGGSAFDLGNRLSADPLSGFDYYGAGLKLATLGAV